MWACRGRLLQCARRWACRGRLLQCGHEGAGCYNACQAGVCPPSKRSTPYNSFRHLSCVLIWKCHLRSCWQGLTGTFIAWCVRVNVRVRLHSMMCVVLGAPATTWCVWFWAHLYNMACGGCRWGRGRAGPRGAGPAAPVCAAQHPGEAQGRCTSRCVIICVYVVAGLRTI